MERKMVCISCPLGCRLTVKWENEQDVTVKGNKCAKGESYAREEILAPKRVVTATIAVGSPPEKAGSPRRLPVKTSAPLLKEHIAALLDKLYGLEVKAPIACGEVLLSDIAGTGVDLVATRTLKEQN
jgi:CxxC motif-containing protein